MRKRDNFRAAFSNFAVDEVAAYDERDRTRLLVNPGIIRNRLKIDAAIKDAARIQKLRAIYGSFAQWLAAHHPRDKPAWIKLFKQTFVFTGGEITGEFLLSIGYLPGLTTRIARLTRKSPVRNPRG